MKRVLIVNNNLHIGGVQKALINLIRSIHKHYQVTLLLFCKCGEYLADVPKDVTVISVSSAYRYLGMNCYDVQGSVGDKFCRSFFAGITRIMGRSKAVALMGIQQETITGYDIAISYLHDGGDKVFYGGCNDFVLRHVQAQQKIAVLHCDYEKCGANTEENRKKYQRFDKIAACSEGCRESFVRVNPDMADKVSTVRNFHDFNKIQSMADEVPHVFSKDVCNIITVARLGKEKGVERAVRAISKLGELKERIQYTIIGDGIKRNEIQNLIDEFSLHGMVELCGEMVNPYGYMRAADLLLIPSYSEAAPLVVDEAACLGIPILSTNTSSAQEMIADRKYGWVCDNSVDGICVGLNRLLTSPDMLEKQKEYLQQCSFDNKETMKQFVQLISGESLCAKEEK